MNTTIKSSLASDNEKTVYTIEISGEIAKTFTSEELTALSEYDLLVMALKDLALQNEKLKEACSKL